MQKNGLKVIQELAYRTRGEGDSWVGSGRKESEEME